MKISPETLSELERHSELLVTYHRAMDTVAKIEHEWRAASARRKSAMSGCAVKLFTAARVK